MPVISREYFIPFVNVEILSLVLRAEIYQLAQCGPIR